MKKIVIILTLLLITGCKQKLNINEEIININYNEYNIQQNDYSSILKTLNEINFSCGKDRRYNGNLLSVSTTNSVINFTISDDYYIVFPQDNKYCYSKEEKVKNLVFLLNGIIKRYTSDDFYNIRFMYDYIESDDETNIRLDKSNQYVIIKLDEPITSLKINEIEFKDNHYEEINLIYQKEKLNQNTIVIRKEINELPNYKISFVNKYGYTFHIIPIYDGITGNIAFETEVK